MKIQTTFQNSRVKITEPKISDIYFIEQDDDGRFYVTSDNGYSGYEGSGFSDLEKSSVIKRTKTNMGNVAFKVKPESRKRVSTCPAAINRLPKSGTPAAGGEANINESANAKNESRITNHLL